MIGKVLREREHRPPNPYAAGSTRPAGLVMALFVASRAVGLLREMVIARQFGTSADLDAYLAAFSLPNMLFVLVAGGAVGRPSSPSSPVTWRAATRPAHGGWRRRSSTG